jgi:hypothetical protein
LLFSVAPKEDRTPGNSTVTQRRTVQIGTGELAGTPDAARTASQRMDSSTDGDGNNRGAPRPRTASGGGGVGGASSLMRGGG